MRSDSAIRPTCRRRRCRAWRRVRREVFPDHRSAGAAEAVRRSLGGRVRQNMAADPIFDLRQGVPVTVPTKSPNCESRVSFVLLWEDPDRPGPVQGPGRRRDDVRQWVGPTIAWCVTCSAPAIASCRSRCHRGRRGPSCPESSRGVGDADRSGFVNGGTRRAGRPTCSSKASSGHGARSTPPPWVPRCRSVVLAHAGSPVRTADVSVKLTAPLTSLSSLSTPIIRHRAAAADTHHIPPCFRS